MTTVPCEMFLCVDSQGDYGAGKDEAAARESYENDIQPLADCDGFRIVKVAIAVPLPGMAVLKGVAPAEGEAELASVS